MTRRRRPLSGSALPLRTRVAVSFGLLTLLVTGSLSLTAWGLTSSYVSSQREDVVLAQVSTDATLVRQTQRFRPDGVDTLLAGLGSGSAASVLVRIDGRWAVYGRPVDAAVLPPGLVAAAAGGDTVTRRLDVDGNPVAAGAVPLGPGADVFVELVPLDELQATLRFLAVLLAGGTVLATMLAAGLGIATARRALRPLDDLTAAAARVARGDLDARLPVEDDPELAALAATFNDTVQDLQERVRRDIRFAGDVSHELRSPLTTLLGAAQVLRRRREELGPAAREAVDLLGGDLDRFARTVDDLLEISRMDEPLDDRDLEPVDLEGLVAAVVDRHHPDPVLESAPDLPAVIADRRRLDAVVTNLCVNAARHGGGAVRVAVLRAGSGVRIEVDDAGPGVAPEHRTEIFERFARGATAGRRGGGTGTGLGLALVAGHVHRHGGTVTVTDRPGGGARFVVDLPVRPADRQETVRSDPADEA